MNDDTSRPFDLPADGLAALATPDVQRLGAHMAQDAFARVFRLTLEADEATLQAALAEIERLARNWTHAAASDDGRAMRLALLVSGIDQWGLAYCQAFGLTAIPGVSRLLGALRRSPDAAAEARLAQRFADIETAEGNAVDFKMALRRQIHLALWHALIACERAEEAQPILATLSGQLLALVRRMPTLGWRLVADTLAHIQQQCLSDARASQGLASASTQELFDTLRQALPREIREPMLAQANLAVLAWQRSRRMH